MKHFLGCTVAFILLFSVYSYAQEETYLVTTGPASWGTIDGSGLIGMSIEVAQQGVSVEAMLGIGTNRVQGWALWPRIYLPGDQWLAFGELPLIQLSETEISIDPDVGLIADTYTWQFIGVGVGVVNARGNRTLRISGGLGVSGGQCLHCKMHGYLSIHIGLSFQTTLTL